MKPLSEPARALGWHLARAALILTALAFTVAYGAVLVVALATALAGYGPWWIPAAMVAALTLPIGAVTWWWAGMERP